MGKIKKSDKREIVNNNEDIIKIKKKQKNIELQPNGSTDFSNSSDIVVKKSNLKQTNQRESPTIITQKITKKRKAQEVLEPTKLKSKKIIFVGDEPQEVKEDVNINNKSIIKSGSKKPKRMNRSVDEEEVKDEDIDNFCDDLNEEDNEQYEDWVKLIEAKLNGKKK